MIEWRLPKLVSATQLLFLGGKIQAQSNTIENRRPNVEQRSTGRVRRIVHIVALVSEIFGGGEDFEIAREVAPNLQIHGIEATQRILILIVVELIAHEAALYAEHDARRVPIAGFPGEYISRNLRDLISQQRDFSGRHRVVDNRCRRELVAGGDLNIAADMHDAIELNSARTDPAQIFFFPENRVRGRINRDVLNRIYDVAPKKCSAKIEVAFQCGHVHSCFGAGQAFGVEIWIILGENIRQAEAAIQLV